MPEDTGQERTEQATVRRREETRRRGQVARSTEVNSVGMLLVGFTVLMVFGGYIVSGIEDFFVGFFNGAATTVFSPTSVRAMTIQVIWRYFLILLPVFTLMAVAGVLVNVLQIGFLFTGEPLQPRWEKINPLEGVKRVFSRRSLEMLVRDIIKIVVVGWIGYAALRDALPVVMAMGDQTVGNIFIYTGSTVFSIAMRILIGYVVIAVLDYAFQRWEYERSMMMTRQEVREELKQTEGDPLIRARIRSVQREIARRRMMEEVPEAAVVITNPTEIAVALAYEPDMGAPTVVAKGQRRIAERIREIAVEHDVPIVENVALAQALFKAVDIGAHIPEDLYAAVAEILAYVYRLQRKKVL